MAKKGVLSYQEVQAKTANPAQRVIMVYRGIEKNIGIAVKILKKKHFEPDEITEVNNVIQLTEQLILELKLALDKEKGGEIAQNLEALYDFWIEYLSDANVEKKPDKLEQILPMVTEIRESWEKVAEEFKKTISTP